MTERIICGDARIEIPKLAPESIDMVMTSPPYWGLRDYGIEPQIWGGDENCKHEWGPSEKIRAKIGRDGNTEIQKNKGVSDIHHGSDGGNFCIYCNAWRGNLGLEPLPILFIKHLCDIFDLIKSKLKNSGNIYVNIGDTYWSATGSCFNPGGGENSLEKNRKIQGTYPLHRGNISDFPDLKSKNLILIPSRFAIEMQTRGWIIRNDIIWHKPNPMPSSVKDRLNTTYEHIFHFVKSRKYYYDLDAIREKWTDERLADITRALEKHTGYQGKYGRGYNVDNRDKLPGQGIKGQPVGNPMIGKNPGDVIHSKYDVPKEDIGPVGGEGTFARWKAFNPRTTHKAGKNPGDFWDIITQPFPEAHFAVYPEALCGKPIKASCPKDVCQTCGKPRERIVEKHYVVPGTNIEKVPESLNESRESKIMSEGRYRHNKDNPESKGGIYGFKERLNIKNETIGFTDCGHNDYKPGIVLDPFAGAGTTGVVARQLGRSFILIEIKKEYCDMMRKRLAQVERPLTTYEAK